MSIRQTVKSILLPREPAFRRLPAGLGAGTVMMTDFAFQSRMYFGFYEREIAADCTRLLHQSRNGFDIGAHDGYYSLAIAKRTGGPVLAVEPEAAIIGRLKTNLEQNNFPVTVVEGKVGAGAGSDTFTLDTLGDEYFDPDFVKMDIEGAELDALSGARRILTDHMPHLIVEVHSRALERDCRVFLERFGYHPKPVSPRQLMAELRPGDYNGWLVCAGRPTG